MALKKPETCKAEANKEISKKNLCIMLVILQFHLLVNECAAEIVSVFEGQKLACLFLSKRLSLTP
jgi:hypothetical protein